MNELQQDGAYICTKVLSLIDVIWSAEYRDAKPSMLYSITSLSHFVTAYHASDTVHFTPGLGYVRAEP